MVTANQLSNVLDIQPDNIPITSFYLGFDEEAKKRKQHTIVLKDLIRYKTEKSYFKNLKNHAQDSVKADFEKIEDYVNQAYNQSNGQGKSVAIFTCSAEELWEIIQFHVPLETSMVINPHPYLRPLVEAASEYRNYAIILVDRAKARIVEVRMGEPVEHLNIYEDDIPDQVKEGDFEGTSERRIERHINEHVHRHLKSVAEQALQLQQTHGYKWVYIGGRNEIINEFKDMLHNYVRERIQGHIVVEPQAPLEEVLEKAAEAAVQTREVYEKQLLTSLSDQIGSQQRGIAGVEGTLNAQQRGQIDTLLVHTDFKNKGYYCPVCNFLSVKQRDECPLDGSTLHRTPDIADNLIFSTFKQGAGVEMIKRDMEDFGHLGALLRFPFQKKT